MPNSVVEVVDGPCSGLATIRRVVKLSAAVQQEASCCESKMEARYLVLMAFQGEEGRQDFPASEGNVRQCLHIPEDLGHWAYYLPEEASYSGGELAVASHSMWLDLALEAGTSQSLVVFAQAVRGLHPE
jgi:hypothetical protein